MVSNTDLFHEAFKLHHAGNLAEAANHYHNILKNEPNHVDATFLLGTLNIQQGNLEMATTFLRKAISLRPDHVAAYNNLGTSLQSQGNLSEAVVIYNRIIERKPEYVEGHINLGNVLQEQDKLDEAIECYNRAIEIKPDYAEAHYNLGNALRKKYKPHEAVSCFSKTIELKPEYAEAHSNLGSILQEQGKLDEAASYFSKAIELKPEYAEAHSNLGTVLQAQGKSHEAVARHRKAIELNPNHAEVHNNLGNMLQEQGKLEEAAEAYKMAIMLEPNHAKAHNNLGAARQEQGKYYEAMEYYKRAISLKPDYAEAHINRSFALLLTGNLEEGWPEYEWRSRAINCTTQAFQQPRWDGTPLNGRSILVHTEQGFGDTIQFVRYLPMVQAKGGHVILECQNSLFRLLKNNAGVYDVIERTPNCELLSHIDVHVPLLSLPGIFGTTFDTIPSVTPYIVADPDLTTQWRTRLSHSNAYKVGIVWAGNPLHKYVYYKRSCSLADFAPLVDIPGLVFYSLQKGPGSVEANDPPKGMNIINLIDELHDFTDTAAIISNLDLVISIDTSVAHLAGAIGKPVWNLLSFVPDWRWFLNRDDSPWYPGMRLFRQSRPNDWTEVFKQVKKALISEISTATIIHL
ncbi:MAG: tetratricopeptide repeat protein [Candidatus Scalindua sp.]